MMLLLLLLLDLLQVKLILGGYHAWLSLKHPLKLRHIYLSGRSIDHWRLLGLLHHLV